MPAGIFSVEGKICLVTGASSGIGAHFARVLTACGARVAGVSRTVHGEEDAASGTHIDCDIRKLSDVVAALDTVEAAFGCVDVLINAAGIAHFERAEKTDDDSFADLMDVNVTGTMRVTRETVKRMRAAKRGGSIIHVTSVLASRTMSGLSAYGAAKAAVEQMTRSQGAEWARHGIRVNALAPGWFPTEMTRPHLDNGLGAVLKSRIPMRRLGNMDDLDGALLLLASDASRYMTGSVVTVDGGFTAGV